MCMNLLPLKPQPLPLSLWRRLHIQRRMTTSPWFTWCFSEVQCWLCWGILEATSEEQSSCRRQGPAMCVSSPWWELLLVLEALVSNSPASGSCHSADITLAVLLALTSSKRVDELTVLLVSPFRFRVIECWMLESREVKLHLLCPVCKLGCYVEWEKMWLWMEESSTHRVQ